MANLVLSEPQPRQFSIRPGGRYIFPGILITLVTAVVYLVIPGGNCCLPSRMESLLDCGSDRTGLTGMATLVLEVPTREFSLFLVRG